MILPALTTPSRATSPAEVMVILWPVSEWLPEFRSTYRVALVGSTYTHMAMV